MQFTPSRDKIRPDGFRRSAHNTGEPKAAPPSRLLAGFLKGPDLGNWGVIDRQPRIKHKYGRIYPAERLPNPITNQEGKE